MFNCQLSVQGDEYCVVVAFRKHTLSCHRMRPALFQVLCEIKEKTGTVKYYISV